MKHMRCNNTVIVNMIDSMNKHIIQNKYKEHLLLIKICQMRMNKNSSTPNNNITYKSSIMIITSNMLKTIMSKWMKNQNTLNLKKKKKKKKYKLMKPFLT